MAEEKIVSVEAGEFAKLLVKSYGEESVYVEHGWNAGWRTYNELTWALVNSTLKYSKSCPEIVDEVIAFALDKRGVRKSNFHELVGLLAGSGKQPQEIADFVFASLRKNSAHDRTENFVEAVIENNAKVEQTHPEAMAAIYQNLPLAFRPVEIEAAVDEIRGIGIEIRKGPIYVKGKYDTGEVEKNVRERYLSFGLDEIRNEIRMEKLSLDYKHGEQIHPAMIGKLLKKIKEIVGEDAYLSLGYKNMQQKLERLQSEMSEAKAYAIEKLDDLEKRLLSEYSRAAAFKALVSTLVSTRAASGEGQEPEKLGIFRRIARNLKTAKTGDMPKQVDKLK